MIYQVGTRHWNSCEEVAAPCVCIDVLLFPIVVLQLLKSLEGQEPSFLYTKRHPLIQRLNFIFVLFCRKSEGQSLNLDLSSGKPDRRKFKPLVLLGFCFIYYFYYNHFTKFLKRYSSHFWSDFITFEHLKGIISTICVPTLIFDP